MEKLIIELKKKHSINVTKDDFKSFTSIRPHIDTLLSKILMGQLVLSNNINSPESYTSDNPDFQMSQDFLKTFQVDDDTFDDIIGIKLIRYSSFLQYLTKTVFGWKMTFNTMDIVDARPPMFISLLSLLSNLVSFMSGVSSYIKTIIEEVLNDKENQQKHLELFEKKEKDLLKNISNYESLVIIQNNYLLDHDQCIERNNKLTEELDEVDIMILQEEKLCLELKCRQEELMKDFEKVRDENDHLRSRFVEDPVKLENELEEIKMRVEEEQRRSEEYVATCSALTSKLIQYKTIDSFKTLFIDNVNIVTNSCEKLLKINKEISSHNNSKRELCEELKKKIRDKRLNINKLQKDKENLQRDVKICAEKRTAIRIKASVVKEKTELLGLKKDKLRIIGLEIEKDLERDREERHNIEVHYEETLKSLDNNVSKTLEEIVVAYRRL